MNNKRKKGDVEGHTCETVSVEQQQQQWRVAPERLTEFLGFGQIEREASEPDEIYGGRGKGVMADVCPCS